MKTDIQINFEKGKSIFFASDFHLGIPDYNQSLKRERKIIKWLDQVKEQAIAIFLMGDLFDFWFEYKTVIPKGYIRLLGKLAEITDSGTPVYLFRGNHDIWAFDYLGKEVGLQLYRKPVIARLNEHVFYLAHGDGLGPGDHSYKFLKKVFENKINQWLFKWLHPDIGSRMGLFFSKKSRYAKLKKQSDPENWLPLEKEMLFIYSNNILKRNPAINYFIFGHRHIPMHEHLNKNSELLVLGDWITRFTYVEFNGDQIQLKKFDD